MTASVDMGAFGHLREMLVSEMERLDRDVARRAQLDAAIASRFEAIRSITDRMETLVRSAHDTPRSGSPEVADIRDASHATVAGVAAGIAGSPLMESRASEEVGRLVLDGISVDRQFEDSAREIVRRAEENASAGIGREAMSNFVGRHRWRQALYLNAYDRVLAEQGMGVAERPDGAASPDDRVMRMLAELDYGPLPQGAEVSSAPAAPVQASRRPSARRLRSLRWLKRYGDVAQGLYAKLKVLDRPVSTKELKRMLGWSRKDVQKTLDALLRDGHVVESEPGVWTLPV